jgi:8-oxo-dGTP diphosphatase
MSEAPCPVIRVVAAVIERGGCFLVTRRLAGTHLEGHWEFPGGKCNAGEGLEECLTREIREELGQAIDVGPEILVTVHQYADRAVELHFFEGTLAGPARAVLGQEMRWVTREDLGSLALPPADRDLVERITRGSEGDQKRTGARRLPPAVAGRGG